MNIVLKDSSETQHLGYLLGKYLPRGSIILLAGNLGTGKTTLVQGIGRGLGINDFIVSPTFTLINEYLDGRLPLYHLDLYRLESGQVNSIYPEIYWEGIEVELGITAIEWCDRLTFKPSNYLKIDLVTQISYREARIQSVGMQDNHLQFLQDFIQNKKR